MTIRSFFIRLALPAAFLAGVAWYGTSAFAADVTPPPAPVVSGATPLIVGEAGCAACQAGQTCEHGVAKASCPKCGKLQLGKCFHKAPNPFPVTLCPGACFGYFQTQWRKWDEVCPYPYLGMGVGDAGRLPGSPAGQRPGGGELSPPRPLDPKVTDPKMADPKKVGSTGLPPIPVAPQGVKVGGTGLPPIPVAPQAVKFVP